ncbi:SCO family protein [Litoribacillus peritrichatus]|uniref:SCO family protein n=1 Tax=Litoribacillus peritrichatus TaxID=718191 RepID=A0ABP7MP45_9GAMM
MNTNRTLGLITAGLVLTALVLATIRFTTAPKAMTVPENLYGQVTPFQLPSVTMESDQGKAVQWQDFDDTPLFLTTGFTSCEYTCPMTMAFYQKLAKKVNNDARLAFLTVDPDTDTPAQLNHYLKSYGQEFVGLRVQQKQQLETVMNSLKQTYALAGASKNIGHQSYIYLKHPKLKGLIVYTADQPNVSLMQQDLKKLSL